MSKERSVKVQVGPGAIGLLGLVFVIAKILNYEPIAGWSWLWILAPFWIGPIVVLVIVGMVIFGAAIVVALEKK